MQDKNIQELISLYRSGEFNTVEKNKNKLFNDKKPIKYLENFLMSQFK